MNGFSVFQNVSTVHHILQPILKKIQPFLDKVVGRYIKELPHLTIEETLLHPNHTVNVAVSPENEWKIQMITRWKQLNDLSQEKIENFYIYVPSEEVPAFKQLIKNHQFQAIICPTSNAT